MIPRVNTPWGWTDGLRRDKLRPGPGQPSELVAENQRQRMFAAAVAAVSEHGYRDSRVADIVRVSGVSRSAFYKHFSDKADCFRETAKAVWEQAYEIPEFGNARVEDALRWADKFPACALFALEAPDGFGRGSLVQEIELWAKVFARQTDCPPLVARAVIAAGFHLAATNLREADEVASFFPQVYGDTLAAAYGHGGISVTRTRRKAPTALDAVPTSPRERLLAAVADELHNRPGDSPTVLGVTTSAKASLSTFYAEFSGLDDLIEQAARLALSRSYDAGDTVGDWLRWLAAHPAEARLAILDVLEDDVQHVPARLLTGIAREFIVEEAVVTALLAHEIESGRGADVHNLEQLVEQLIALPAGSTAAREAA